MPSWKVNFDVRVDVAAQDVILAAARVEALAAVIRQIPIPPRVQAKIDALNILRAVRGTTGIEGVELSEDEVERVIQSPVGERALPAGRERDEQEVRNAADVMTFVAALVARDPDVPLTEALICWIHQLTTQEISYPNNVPGQYRNHAVSAGTYVPPRSGEEVRSLMKEFVEWFKEGPPRQWPPAVRAAVAHFFVISIHPFGDGNGRTARAVESLLLFQGHINARGFYSLANFYYQHRSQYVALLDHVRFETKGDVTPFVRFALEGLVSELTSVHEAVIAEVRVIAFRDFAREQLRGKIGTKPGERMYHLLLELAAEPVSLATLRSGEHWLYQKVTPKTLSRDLNFLKEHELIILDAGHVRANLDVMREFTVE